MDHFIPRWSSKFFILIGCSVLHMQLWHHNEGTSDVIKILHIPHEYVLCAKFKKNSLVWFQRYRGPKFFRFPIWLPHHATYEVIIIIETFSMSSRTNGENFVSIQQAVVEKNTKVLCRQTNKQTNKHMDPNAIPSPS